MIPVNPPIDNRQPCNRQITGNLSKISTMHSLIEKYNYEVPRYTSYPVITQWQDQLDATSWASQVVQQLAGHSKLSLYLHLPFCESLCTYCGCNKHITTNHQVEEPYLEAILKEWQMYTSLLGEKPTISELHLGGGTPTFFSPSNLKTLIEGLFSEGVKRSEEAAFSFEAHPSSTTEDHLTTLAKLGFGRISIGVQTFDEEILRIIHRFQTTEQVYAVVKKARETGYDSINFDLIYGLPKQNLDDIYRNMDHVSQLMPERIAFYSYAHVPWTAPSQRAYDENDLPLGEEKRTLYEKGKELLLDLGYEEIGMDHFALPGDQLSKARQGGFLNRNFMGYTDLASDNMLGLGVSSISELGKAYHQNVKTLKDYYTYIENAQLPTLRTHLLSEEEYQTKKTIKNLMCQLKHVDVSGSVIRDEDTFREMQEDGLVIQTAFGWEITEKGLPFIRNIAACFDPYYQRKREVKQFSSAI